MANSGMKKFMDFLRLTDDEDDYDDDDLFDDDEDEKKGKGILLRR